MTSKLSVFAKPTHGDEWLNYVRQLQPYDILILDPDIQQVSDAHVASLESEITIRRWEWDDGRTDQNPHGVYGRLRDDPEGLARWQVDQYRELIIGWEREAKRRGIPWPEREQLVLHLTNEPDTNTLMRQINRNTVVATKLAWNVGFKVDGLNLSTGHPVLLGPDGTPDWGPLMEALEALERSGSYAVVHEYFNSLGVFHPDTNPWHIKRHHWAPRGPKYKIGEFGLEEILNGLLPDHHGWQGRIPPEEMVNTTAWYLDNVRDDVVAVRFYMTDHVDRTWRTFDSTPIHPQLIEVGRRFPSKSFVAWKPVEPPSPPTAKEPVMGIIDPLVGQTLINVESGGRAFGPDGRLLIRFETHIFKQYLANDTLYAKHFVHGSPVWTGQMYRRSEGDPWREVHTGNQSTEWEAFELAMTLSRHAAMKSISMGLGQIMGFNFRRVGYKSSEEMFRSFSKSEPAQTIAFINFFLSDPHLAQAVQARDWRTIARLYNGPGNVDHVASLLEKTYIELIND